jgi:hypothetical protein
MLGILTSATFVLLRVYVGLDGFSGVFIILGSLPTSLLLRHLQPQYHLPALLAGQSLVWSCTWLVILSRRLKTHDNAQV